MVHNATQRDTTRYNAIQRDTTRYNATQRNAAQHSVMHSIIAKLEERGNNLIIFMIGLQETVGLTLLLHQQHAASNLRQQHGSDLYRPSLSRISNCEYADCEFQPRTNNLMTVMLGLQETVGLTLLL
jgi:hypothetical protein